MQTYKHTDTHVHCTQWNSTENGRWQHCTPHNEFVFFFIFQAFFLVFINCYYILKCVFINSWSIFGKQWGKIQRKCQIVTHTQHLISHEINQYAQVKSSQILCRMWKKFLLLFEMAIYSINIMKESTGLFTLCPIWVGFDERKQISNKFRSSLDFPCVSVCLFGLFDTFRPYHNFRLGCAILSSRHNICTTHMR